jgi:amyloid beta precursor protein binding protein 1
VFTHPDCAFDSSSVLWRAAAAVSQFVSENNVLPLLGRIPDMTSDTASYVALQEAYRAKAKEDAARVRRILQEHDPAMGDLEEKEQQLVDWAIANAVSLRVVHNRTLREELESPANGEIAMGLMMLEMGHHGVLYPCFRAGAEFAEKHGRYPESADQDFTEFRSLVAAECPEGSSVPDEIVLEFCRASNSELQNVAAVLGGVGAQEIIKLVTLQRVPMQNTFIYNGIAGGGSVMKL